MPIVTSIPCANRQGLRHDIQCELRSKKYRLPTHVRDLDHEVLLSIARYASSQNSPGQARPLLRQTAIDRETELDKRWTRRKV
jgi:hypothetical protein